MKYLTKYQLCLSVLLLIFSISTLAEESTNVPSETSDASESTMIMQTYPGLLIQEDDNKIRIQTLQSDHKTIASTWDITAALLHLYITDDDCLEVDADNCADLNNYPRWQAHCTHPCLFYAPHLVLADPQSKKLYIYNQLGMGGNASASVMLFVLDPALRSIRKLAWSSTNINDAGISPMGTTLALAFSGYSPTVQVVSVADGKTFDVKIPQPLNFSATSNVDKRPVIFLDKLNWLSENRLQLRERVYLNKWSTEGIPMSVSQKTVQIDFNKKDGVVIAVLPIKP